jgi:autotransporter-associated beta strand protein
VKLNVDITGGDGASGCKLKDGSKSEGAYVVHSEPGKARHYRRNQVLRIRAERFPWFRFAAVHRSALRCSRYYPTRFLLVAFLFVVATWTADGADRYWTGNGLSDVWSEGDNWNPEGPPQDGDTLIFGNLGSKRSNNNNLSNLRVQSILFNSSGYSLGGNPILLNSDITAAHTSGNNRVRFGVEFSSGGGSINTANAGLLEIVGTVTVANKQQLIVIAFGSDLTISGAIVGDGQLLKLGFFSLFLTGTAANTYTGPTVIEGGAVYLRKSSGARAISPQVSIGEESLNNCFLADLTGGQYPPEMSVVIGEQGTWGLTNGATVTNLVLKYAEIVGEGLLNLKCDVDSRGSSQIYCSLYLGDKSRTFSTGDFNPVLSIYGHILGPSAQGANSPGIIKAGLGKLLLHAQNTYSGPTVVSHGGVSVHHPQALGTATGETRVGPFGLLEFGPLLPLNTVFSEPIVMDGGRLEAHTSVVLNGPFAVNEDSMLAGPNNGRLDIKTSITGPGGFRVYGGYVRFSGTTANTFAGQMLVEPGSLSSVAVLELAKPDDVPAVPSAVTLQGADPVQAVLRQFQNNGARTVSIDDWGKWDLNGYVASPALLRFLGSGMVEGGFNGVFPGLLNFAGLTVNTQIQVLPKLSAPSNYVAWITGDLHSFSPTNDLYIPPGVALDIRADILGSNLQKRGPGKLVLSGDNQVLAKIYAKDGELVSRHARALGGHTTVFDGATLWLDSVFNFGSLTIQGRGFQGTNGALAAQGLALFSSNVVLSGAATIQSATTNANLHIQGVISGTGPLTKEGLGMLTFEGSAPNTFTGDMLVNAGMLVLAKNNYIPAVPGSMVIGSGLPGLPGATVLYGGHDQIWNRITINRASLLDLNGWDEFSGDVALNGNAVIATRTGALYLGEGVNVFAHPRGLETSEISGRIGLGPGPHRFQVAQDDRPSDNDLLINARIFEFSTAADILKEGPGSVLLNSSNSFRGSLIIHDGRLYASDANAFGTSAGGTFVNGNGSLGLDASMWVREEPLTLNSTNPFAIYAIGTSNAWSGNITLESTAGIYVESVLHLLGLFDCCGGVISGPGGITKNGPGTLLISGLFPNDYAGLTLVNDGVLEASRILSPALPGDVFVTGNNSSLRTGRIPGNTALTSTSSVTLSNGAVWKLNPLNTETVRAISGNGILDMGNLGSGASLTVENTNQCEFSGTIVGTGALNKRGPAQLLLSGQSPIYGGSVTVFQGTLWVDGRMAGAPVTVKAGAQLRGDGAVANVTATEQDSIVQVDASFTDHPGRQGGDFEVAYLTLGPGSGVGFDIAGPSPTGGNDLLIAHGPVSLGNARLSAAFAYPPRENDVITLLRNNSPTAITGTFVGWPEGVTRKLGDVPVRATYLGGNGNDFTLTVTNLPLAYDSYRLAEGNGNQTVEPDECNLVYISLLNRRTSPLMITNATLRANTPGAVVTIASANYPSIPAGAVRENFTPFQFRTDRSLSCGRPVTFELVLGVQGEGEFAVTFEVVAGEGEDCARPTGPCESCFFINGRFTTNSPTLVRAHTFVGGPSICFPPKRCPDTGVSGNQPVPYLTHVFTNATTNALCVTAQLHFGCPNTLTNTLGAVAYLGTNDYHDPCVNYLGDTGADGTQPFSFRVPARTNFVILVSARATNAVCPTYSLEVFGPPCPPPTLHIAKDGPETVRLQWSTASPGYSLQTTNEYRGAGPYAYSNAVGDVVIVDGQYTATNVTAQPRQFFRLTK